MEQIVSATVVQAAPVAFDLERTLDRVVALAAEASAGGAQLVVFPEAFVSGYPKGADFGAVVGRRSTTGATGFSATTPAESTFRGRQLSGYRKSRAAMPSIS